MPLKHRKRRDYKPLRRTVFAACLGIVFTLLMLGVFSVLILNGYLEERKSELYLLVSVFCGSVLTAVILSSANIGGLPKALIAWASYMFMLLLCSTAGKDEKLFGDMLLKTAITAGAGNISWLVTNLVKSNKSYINKSKRKRAIT